MDFDTLLPVLALSVVNKSIIDMLSAPLRKHWPEADLWWLVYVAFVTGTLIGWFAGVNALSEWIPNVVEARLLTSCCVGGGSSVIYEIVKGVKDAGDGLKAGRPTA